MQLKSVQQLRTATTMLQQYDFSCGSAALATLLTHHYGYPVTEQMVFEEMYVSGDQQLIRQAGFSLLDMKSYLGKHGFIGDGFVQSLDTLRDAKLPAIVLIIENGYQHFVVIKGVQGRRILVGDPARGTRAIDRADFEALWPNRLLFVIHDSPITAKFNSTVDWRAAPSAPINANGLGALNTLNTISLPNKSAGDF